MSDFIDDYIIKKKRSASKPSIVFRDYRWLAALFVIVSPVLIIFGFGAQFQTDCTPHTPNVHNVCHVTGYAWSQDKGASMFLGCLGIVGLMALKMGLKRLINPVYIGLYLEGLWLSSVGLIPWNAVIGAKCNTQKSYRSIRSSYRIFFKKPKNLKYISPVRRFFIKNSEGPLEISFSNLPLTKSKYNGKIVWTPELIENLINQCVNAHDKPDDIRKYLNHPSDIDGEATEQKNFIKSIQQKKISTYKNNPLPALFIKFSAFLLILFSILCFYTMGYPTFFPSQSWSILSKNISWLIVIMPILPFMGHIGLRNISTVQPIKTFLGFIFILSIFYLITRIGFCLGLAHVYTEVIGDEYTQDVPATIKHETYNHGIQICFDTPTLIENDFSEICMQGNQLQTPQNVLLRLRGKKSWFGFAVDRFSILPPPSRSDPRKIAPMQF